MAHRSEQTPRPFQPLTGSIMIYPRLLALLSSAAFLAACGGGGGDSPEIPVTAPSTDTFQLKTAYINSVIDTRSLPFRLTGLSSGVNVTGSGTLTQGALTGTTFEGQAAFQKTTAIIGEISATLNGRTETIPLAITTTSFTDSNYMPLGATVSIGGYSVPDGIVTIPQTVKVNDTGIFLKSKNYSSSTKSTLIGTSTIAYAIQPDTSSTALLKLIQTDQNTLGATVATSTVTHRMTPAGGLTRLSETYLAGTNVLNITY